MTTSHGDAPRAPVGPRLLAATPAGPVYARRLGLVLEENAELSDGLDEVRRAHAAGTARAVVLLQRGVWTQPEWALDQRRAPGLLVLDGLLLRASGSTTGVTDAELLAAGDLLRRWRREDAAASVPRQSG